MKKKGTLSKLSLNKTTVASLSKKLANEIQGGNASNIPTGCVSCLGCPPPTVRISCLGCPPPTVSPSCLGCPPPTLGC